MLDLDVFSTDVTRLVTWRSLFFQFVLQWLAAERLRKVLKKLSRF